ncbi:MAG: hypothetical protein GY757_54500 [bacterium]|nr:hypothetical protein [bacterium]
MIRRFFKLILLVLVVFGLATLGKSILSKIGSVFSDSYAKLERKPLSALVYRVEKDRWLSFTLSKVRDIKIISNSISNRKYKERLQDPLHYALQCRLVNSSGTILAERSYHHLSKPALHRSSASGSRKVEPSSFFLRSNLLVMEGKVLILNTKYLSPKEKPARLMVRLKELQTPLNRVYIRAYARTRSPEYKLKTIWDRKSQAAKSRLARGNIYPVSLTNSRERDHMVRFRWNVMAPQGIPGTDFNRRKLYILKKTNRTGDALTLTGIYTAPGLKCTIPLPAEGGRFRFRFSALEPQNRSQTIHLEHEAPYQTTQHFEVPWNGHHTYFQKQLQGGLITVTAPAQMVVRVFHLTQSIQKEITPEFIIVPVYIFDNKTPLEYKISHLPGSGTPFRFDFRATAGAKNSIKSDTMILFKLLDNDEKTITSGAIPVNHNPSLFTRYKRAREAVSQTTTRYFLFSPAVKKVHFSIETKGVRLLAAAYNRPPGLEKHVRVPQYRYAYTRRSNLRKSWFRVEAANHDSFYTEGKITTLSTQPKPRSANTGQSEITKPAGNSAQANKEPSEKDGKKQVSTAQKRNYRIEMLYPAAGRHMQANAPMHPLFFKSKQTAVQGRRASAAYYRAITHGAPMTLVFKEGLRRRIAPTLVYLNPGYKEKNGRLSLYLDKTEKPFWTGRLAEGRGELTLPRIPAGKHRVLFRCDPESPRLRLFLNKVKPGTRPPWLKRLAVALGRNPVYFDFYKSQPGETLNIKLFTPPGLDKTVELDVAVQRIQRPFNRPLENWTLGNRRYKYDLAAIEGNRVPLLRKGNQYVRDGDTMFLTMGRDCPNGNYRIRVNLHQNHGRGGYFLQLYRKQQGRFEQRRIKIIQGMNDD